MASWLVPPIVVPVFLTAMIVADALSRAYLRVSVTESTPAMSGS